MTGWTIHTNAPFLLGRNAFDSLFNEFFANPAPQIKTSTQGYPLTDLYHEDGKQIIEMALAGFDKKDIVIECGPDARGENSIIITAEKGKEPDENNTRRIAQRGFKKTFFDYGAKLDLEAAVATFENGLLKIAIPQKERKSLYKSIDIK